MPRTVKEVEDLVREKIEPLLSQVHDIAREHEINYFAAIQMFDMDGPNVEQGSIASSNNLLGGERSAQLMYDLFDVCQGMAIAVKLPEEELFADAEEV